MSYRTRVPVFRELTGELAKKLDVARAGIEPTASAYETPEIPFLHPAMCAL